MALQLVCDNMYTHTCCTFDIGPVMVMLRSFDVICLKSFLNSETVRRRENLALINNHNVDNRKISCPWNLQGHLLEN